MPERKRHNDFVKDWCQGWAGTLPAPGVVDVYERALDALWRRANMSPGEVTLMAIVDRVLHQGVVFPGWRRAFPMAQSSEELRKFIYELTVRLMAWESTTLLLGEYNLQHFEHPTYSAIDGIITLKQEEISGEQQRLLQIIKMRGTSHSRELTPPAPSR